MILINKNKNIIDGIIGNNLYQYHFGRWKFQGLIIIYLTGPKTEVSSQKDVKGGWLNRIHSDLCKKQTSKSSPWLSQLGDQHRHEAGDLFSLKLDQKGSARRGAEGGQEWSTSLKTADCITFCILDNVLLCDWTNIPRSGTATRRLGLGRIIYEDQ